MGQSIFKRTLTLNSLVLDNEFDDSKLMFRASRVIYVYVCILSGHSSY